MTMVSTRREMDARYDAATAWRRKHCPVTAQGEELLARQQAMRQRHAIEAQQLETEIARYLNQAVMPLERTQKRPSDATEERFGLAS